MIDIKSILKKIEGHSVTALHDMGISRADMKRVLLELARSESECWPFNSMEAHRYALRMARRYENANGGMSNYEFLAGYESAVSHYVNTKF